MSKIAILGVGMIGKTIALDLNKNGHNITCFDLNIHNLEFLEKNYGIDTKQVNLLDYDYTIGIADYDFVVSAVPGHMGYRVLEKVIKAGKNCVDISFFPEDPSPLNELALENDVFVVYDCGIAPGMSNLILGYESQNMEIKRFNCYVGGLPQELNPPFNYKAPFSPVDVIEEYVRPVRKRKDGVDIVVEPLTECQIEYFDDNYGELEGFNTDGLRSLLTSFPEIPNMSEKTLRYPGYAEKIKLLKDMGFFDAENIETTARILKKGWYMNPEDKDFTAMSVQISNDDKLVVYHLFDTHDGEFSSMARTTAYTCTAMVNYLLDNPLEEYGVFPPEYMGKNAFCFDYIIYYLKTRKVDWTRNVIMDDEDEIDEENEVPYVSDDFTIGPDGAFEMTEDEEV